MAVSNSSKKGHEESFIREKLLSQGVRGDAIEQRLKERIPFLDISKGHAQGDLVILDRFELLPGKISLQVSPDLTREEITEFLLEVMKMFTEIDPERFQSGGDLNTFGSLAIGYVYYSWRDIEPIKPMIPQ